MKNRSLERELENFTLLSDLRDEIENLEGQLETALEDNDNLREENQELKEKIDILEQNVQ